MICPIFSLTSFVPLTSYLKISERSQMSFLILIVLEIYVLGISEPKLVHYEPVSSKIVEQFPEILVSNVSNRNPWLLLLVWTFGYESHTGSQPLTWSSNRIPWFWISYLYFVQKIKLHHKIQGDVLLTILELPMFPIIVPSTTCHFHQRKIIFSKFLPMRETIINSWWWCYKF